MNFSALYTKNSLSACVIFRYIFNPTCSPNASVVFIFSRVAFLTIRRHILHNTGTFIVFYSRNVNVGQLRDAVQATDPEIGSDQLDDYVYWAFQVETVDEAVNAIHVDELAERLRQGSLRRCGPQYGASRSTTRDHTPTGLHS